jgi:hypothetical protein
VTYYNLAPTAAKRSENQKKKREKSVGKDGKKKVWGKDRNRELFDKE